MPIAPFSENYPKGTHFSDGVRVGPIYPTGYSQGPVGGNFSTPLFRESPADQLRAPGVLLGPEVIYSITPYQAQNNAFSGPNGVQLTAAGLFTLQNNYTTGNPGAVSLVTLPSPIVSGKSDPNGQQTFTQAFLMDVPRCVSVTITGALTVGTTLTAYGIDMYGFYVYSTITASTTVLSGAGTVIFPKAMQALLGVYCNSAVTTALNFGTSDVYGLPYRLDNASFLLPTWKGQPLYVSSSIALGSFRTLAASSTTVMIPAQLATGQLGGPGGASTTAGNIGCVNAADPYAYGVGNLNPVSTAISHDPRGLICIPGYETGLAQSTYVSNLSINSCPNLTLRLYVPGALSTKPGLYANPATGGQALPTGAVAGQPVLIPPYSSAPACLPLAVPTLPVDLYGSPQYWPA